MKLLKCRMKKPCQNQNTTGFYFILTKNKKVNKTNKLSHLAAVFPVSHCRKMIYNGDNIETNE